MPLRDVIRPFASSKTLLYVAWLALLVGLYSLLPVLKEKSSFKDYADMPSQVHAGLSLSWAGCSSFESTPPMRAGGKQERFGEPWSMPVVT